MARATPQREWRFELNPFRNGLMVDYFTQADDPRRVVEPQMSVFIAEDWKFVELWGFRKFCFTRYRGEPAAIIPVKKPQCRPLYQTECRADSPRVVCHLELNEEIQDHQNQLLISQTVPDLPKLRIRPQLKELDIWFIPKLLVHDGAEILELFLEPLDEPDLHVREDEAARKVHNQNVLFFPKSAS